ncbi:hypothetical protein H8E88_00760, partial [candidate division KSB1 bacterium]|nr:hypothetical protein [candidate division KSB1 bacterium]
MTVSTQRKILNEESITLKFIEIIVIFFGLWTIYCNLFSILNLSFSSLYRYSLIFIVFSTILYHLVSKSKTVSTSGADVTPNSHKIKIPEIVKWISALCIVLLFLITESHALFWISSVCFLILIHFEKNSHGDNQKIDRCISNREIWVVLGVAILAGVITLIVHRPDADDATYLNSIVFALDFPDLPFLKYDGMHGIPDIPINIITYRIHSYEMFVAILSNFTGISPIAICHLILPPFFACFVVFTNWLVLQSTCPKMHLPALIFVLFILLIWGDSHRTYGNFSFVRLFQGKSIVVSAWIPLIFYYAFEFVKNKDIRTWILLFFAQAAAMGFSSSAIVAAPLVVFIVLTGSWRPNKNETKLVGIGILSSIYIILI